MINMIGSKRTLDIETKDSNDSRDAYIVYLILEQRVESASEAYRQILSEFLSHKRGRVTKLHSQRSL